MKVYFSECVLLNKEEANGQLTQKWISDLYSESEWSSYSGGYMVECDEIVYDEFPSFGDCYITINGEQWSFNMEGMFDEDHLEMWGFDDFDEIPSGYIFEVVSK